MMREVQDRYYQGRHYGTTEQEFTCPDLQKLATCFGLGYVAVHDTQELVKIKDVFADGQPWLVDIRIDGNAKVLNRYDDVVLS